MKVVGNCPSCGNPIYGERTSAGQCVKDPMRTCFCAPLSARPVVTPWVQPYISPQPFHPPTYPYWWSNAGTTTAASGNTITLTSQSIGQKPPDEDGALVA